MWLARILAELDLSDQRQGKVETRAPKSLTEARAWTGSFGITPPHTSYFPGGASGKDPACELRGHKRCKLDPRVGKSRWRRS